MNTLFKTVTHSLSSKETKNSVIRLHQYQDTDHKILIEGLEIEMSIGLLPEEKKHKQRVIISLEVDLEPKDNYEDSIENTVCYATIIQDIEKLTDSKHFDLVETLTTEIIDHCIHNFNINKVTATVKKPDIIKNAKAVGFSMTRAKQQ